MKRFIAAAALALATSAQANSTVTTDYTDLWYTRGEDGWGVNLVQQEDTIFATLYVYDNTRTPMWYVASGVTYQGSTGGTLRFSGTLYETSGPWFASLPFNSSQVTVTPVGTFTFTSNAVNSGTITYSVNSVSVVKNVERQTWRTQNIAGRYRGATIGNYSGCSSGNGPYEEDGTYTVTQSGNAVTIIEEGGGFSCTYSGVLTQAGQMGTITGNGTCTDGFAQSFVATEVKADINSLAMRVNASLAGSCTFTGRMGGMRRP